MSLPLSLLELVEGSVVLTPTGILFLGPRGAVTPLVCSGMEVAVVAVAGVGEATVVFRVCKMETVVGPYMPGKVLDSGASSSPVGPQAMNSVSVVGLPPRKSKLLKLAPCRCLFPLLRRACWSVAAPLLVTADGDVGESRGELGLAEAGGLGSPTLGTRAATWSLGLCTRLARGLCICPWLCSMRGGRGLHKGTGTRASWLLLALHRRGGRWGGRGRGRNSGPGPRASHAGNSMASWNMAISIQAWLPRGQPGQRMDMELHGKERGISGLGGWAPHPHREEPVHQGGTQPLSFSPKGLLRQAIPRAPTAPRPPPWQKTLQDHSPLHGRETESDPHLSADKATQSPPLVC